MEGMIKSSDKIGEIVTGFPKAIELLKEYRIDFCCGGNRPLSDAIKEQDIDEKELLNKLNKSYEKFQEIKLDDIDWRYESLTELADFIVNKHHVYMHKELPVLSELTAKILRVHGAGHSELSKVYKLFHTLKMELEEHLIKEEEIVFPFIKQYEKEHSDQVLDLALKAIKELEDEHEGAGKVLKELRLITSQYVVPEDGCSSYALTYKKLEEMESDLFSHIHLENNILFPRLMQEKGAH